jgi:hypothetical protein
MQLSQSPISDDYAGKLCTGWEYFGIEGDEYVGDFHVVRVQQLEFPYGDIRDVTPLRQNIEIVIALNHISKIRTTVMVGQ